MINIDWKKDYHREFICPKCHVLGMGVWGKDKLTNKRRFHCNQCGFTCKESWEVSIEAVKDPSNTGIIWFKSHKISDFICPECLTKNIYFKCIDKNNKKLFKCKKCNKHQYDSIDFRKTHIISKFSDKPLLINSFCFNEDLWDLRAINTNFDLQDSNNGFINFSAIKQHWFKREVKKYIQYKCQVNSPFGSIKSYLSDFRNFSNYLYRANISDFTKINRNLILDYLAKEKKNTQSKLGTLRSFFMMGTAKRWFKIDQDIIRDEDYPKKSRRNPDPLSNRVREQVEQNLHKLPDPIARMWIICFFSAMRPGELALLKQDCLVQEGEYWKLVWARKKNGDYHQIPITRTIAKVVQEQLEYIKNMWGKDWNYLFCHYRGLSNISLSKIKLEPVKKVISKKHNPLSICINTLIKNLNIRDENNQLAKFTVRILRTTRLTQLFEQGHDLAVVSAWAGHKDFATTSTYYTKVSCDLIEQEAGHIQRALVNSEGHYVLYESFPKSFWERPQAHKLELSGTHINTPIYGYCGLDLNQDCHKFRACYTCCNFVATAEKLPQYIKTRDELRSKQSQALTLGQDVLVEQFGTQADQLDKIIASLQESA